MKCRICKASGDDADLIVVDVMITDVMIVDSV